MKRNWKEFLENQEEEVRILCNDVCIQNYDAPISTSGSIKIKLTNGKIIEGEVLDFKIKLN